MTASWTKLTGALLAVVLCFLSANSLGQASSPPVVNIAAASDLSLVMKQIAPAFEKRTGMKVNVSFGSSGNFYSQILNGAPFDVFLSADLDYPRRLIAAGAADGNSLYIYGIGHIVVWVPGKLAELSRHGLKVLLEPSVRKIAIANPDHAPYGRAAVAALRKAGIYERVEQKLVLGENVSQAAQFVASGNADAGLISLSLTREMKGPTDILVESYPPVEQAAVVIRAAGNRGGAEAFMNFLQSDDGKHLLEEYGFMPPRGTP